MVMIAREARSHAATDESQVSQAFGIASQIARTGSGSPMTPVENGHTVSLEVRVNAATEALV